MNPFTMRHKGTMDLATLWSQDPKFLSFYEIVAPRAICGIDRCYVLYQLARGKRHLAELGVARGGTAQLLWLAGSSSLTLDLFDTFEGMPTNDEGIPKGHYRGSIEEIQALLPQAYLWKGEFPNGPRPSDRAYDLVHLDCDLWKATRSSIEYFWPRLLPGGVLIIDDYNTNLENITAVIDSKFTHHEIFRFAYAQAVIFKR